MVVFVFREYLYFVKVRVVTCMFEYLVILGDVFKLYKVSKGGENVRSRVSEIRFLGVGEMR